jgi:ABC-type multidrug transport system fused ATPase/permease subunit
MRRRAPGVSASEKRPPSAFRITRRILRLGRPYTSQFFLVAVLVSLGTVSSLFQPWVYRTIVNDVAGVFVANHEVIAVEREAGQVALSLEHAMDSLRRMFHGPLRQHRLKAGERPRQLPSRTLPQAVATIVVGSFLLFAARLISEACRVAGDNRATILAGRIEQDYILGTFRHVMRLPLEFLTRRPSGAIAHQIDQTDNITPFFTAVSQEIWPSLFQLVVIVATISQLNWELGLIVLIAAPAYAIVSWKMTRRLGEHIEEYYGLWDEVSARIQQGVASIKTLFGLGAASHEADEVQRVAHGAFATYVARGRLQNRFMFLQELIVSSSKAIALLLAGIKALEHQLTPGDIVLFVAYLDRIFDPIEDITALLNTLQEHATALERSERLNEVPEAPGATRAPLAPGPGAIEFRDVHWAYRKDRPILRGLSLTIAPGEHVALVGPSGAGKTTLADLLMAFYEPQSGSILVDGQDLREVSPESVRAAVRGVSVDGALLRMSIAENIRYGRFGADDAAVREAATLAGLAPLLDRLPEGIETMVGERGVELSTGERQRILLARAFIAHPRILILDEATANLDFRTEGLVKEAIRELARGRTTLTIAHRRSMVEDADRVLVLRQGVIEQQGPPAKLADVPGYFHDLVHADAAHR